MPIRLQSTVGPFDESFLEKIPKVEKAMLAHRLDPSLFVISKDQSTIGNARACGPVFRDYTVFVGDKHFTVTQASDVRFLEYFYEHCIAPAEKSPTPEHKLGRVIAKLVHWMDQPVFNER